MSGAPAPPIRIAYVISPYRTGSTLLSRLLDLQPGYAAVGEVGRIATEFTWELPCGCGRRHRDCDYWADLISRVEPADARRTWMELVHPGQRVQLVSFARGGLAPRFGRAGENVRSVYAELSARYDGAALVDETKVPWYGFALAAQSWAEVSFVEIVRHPEEVIRSWSRAKEYLPARPPDVIARDWVRAHATARLVRARTGARWTRIDYRDLVERPDSVVRAVVGNEPVGLTRQHGRWSFEAADNHMYAANPDKLERGRQTLRPSTPNRPGTTPWQRIAGQYWRRLVDEPDPRAQVATFHS